jgi:hypothetical protein
MGGKGLEAASVNAFLDNHLRSLDVGSAAESGALLRIKQQLIMILHYYIYLPDDIQDHIIGMVKDYCPCDSDRMTESRKSPRTGSQGRFRADFGCDGNVDTV